MSNIQTALASQPRSRIQKRWHERIANSEMVTLFYVDKFGRSRTQKSRILDFSRLGMSVSVPDRLDIRSFVHIRCPALKINGNASVRHQLKMGLGYLTGLEFVGGLFYVEPQ